MASWRARLIAVASSVAAAEVADVRQYDMNCGPASTATMPIIAMTTMSSVSEKPAS
jgi:hypothetical protein